MTQNLPIINKKIKEIRCQSFILDNQIVSDLIALYLLLEDENWYKFTVSDGVSTISLINSPKLSQEESYSKGFSYPIYLFEQFSIADYGEIKSIKEYLWKGHLDESIGFLVSFDNEKYISITEKNDSLRVKNTCIVHKDYELVDYRVDKIGFESNRKK